MGRESAWGARDADHRARSPPRRCRAPARRRRPRSTCPAPPRVRVRPQIVRRSPSQRSRGCGHRRAEVTTITEADVGGEQRLDAPPQQRFAAERKQQLGLPHPSRQPSRENDPCGQLMGGARPRPPSPPRRSGPRVNRGPPRVPYRSIARGRSPRALDGGLDRPLREHTAEVALYSTGALEVEYKAHLCRVFANRAIEAAVKRAGP